MLTFHLVKKDFLLAKKQILIMMAISVAVPLFVTWNMAETAAALSFIFCVIFTELLLIQYVSVMEAKFPKASALLHSAPYTRKSYVTGKYMFFLIIFAYCTAVISVVGIVLPRVGRLSLTVILAVLLCNIIIYGTYLPIFFKLGYEKTKFFFNIAIFILSFGIAIILANPLNIVIGSSIIERINEIPTPTLNAVLLALCCVLLHVSMMLSEKIYSKKDL